MTTLQLRLLALTLPAPSFCRHLQLDLAVTRHRVLPPNGQFAWTRHRKQDAACAPPLQMAMVVSHAMRAVRGHTRCFRQRRSWGRNVWVNCLGTRIFGSLVLLCGTWPCRLIEVLLLLLVLLHVAGFSSDLRACRLSHGTEPTQMPTNGTTEELLGD